MTTHKTLSEARVAVTEKDEFIAEIQHATEGRCFVRIGCRLETLRMVLKRKPVVEIVKLIAEYPARIYVAPATCKCTRCRKEIETAVAITRQGVYHIGGSAITTQDPYCADCDRDLNLQAGREF